MRADFPAPSRREPAPARGLATLLGLAAVLLGALAGPAGAQGLVLDINTTAPVVQPSSAPDQLLRTSGGLVLFTAADPTHGRELWTLDPAGEPQIVDDLFQGTQSSDPDWLTEMPDGRVVFVAEDAPHGRELWITDGTASGTERLSDINPGTKDAAPQGLVVLGNHVCFFANDGVHGFEPWRSDGTALGTVGIADVITGPQGISPFELPFLATNGTQLLFAVYSVSLGTWGVWASDGTAGGTFDVATLDNAPLETPDECVVVGGEFLFPARDASLGLELWSSDGTVAGTAPLVDLFPGGDANPSHLRVVRSTVYFQADGGTSIGTELYRSDGTAPGTTLVTDLAPGTGVFGSSSPVPIGELGGQLVFQAFTLDAGVEPWITDGTALGTLPLGDLNPLSTSSMDTAEITDSAVFGGELYFRAAGTSTDYEVWKTDGTSAGTVQVIDLQPGVVPSTPTDFLTDGRRVLFAADAGTLGLELYQTDGTAPGTALVDDIFPADISESSTPRELTRVGDLVVFSANDGVHGRELWVTDGSSAGTSLLYDVQRGPGDSDPERLLAVNGRVFFFAENDASGAEPWATDGTPAGTIQLADLTPGSFDTFWSGSDAAVHDGYLYFPAITQTKSALWRTDGTPAGTGLYLESLSSPFAMFVGDMTSFQGELYLRMSMPEDAAGIELYRSNGTPGDFELVADIQPGFAPGMASPTPLVEAGGLLYFRADDGVYGRELWKTDGTTAGTSRVTDLVPGSGSSDPSDLVAVGSRILFLALDDTGELQPYASDGTPAGTVRLTVLTEGAQAGNVGAGGDTGYFRGQEAGGATQLWSTDGTPAGTQALVSLTSTNGPASFGFDFDQPATGPQVVFPNDDGGNGSELWMTDGTIAGSGLGVELNPGSGSAFPTKPVRLGGVLLLGASDGTHGAELMSVPLPVLDMWVAEPFGNSCGPTPLSLSILGEPVGDNDFDFVIQGPLGYQPGFVAVTNKRGGVPISPECTSSVSGTLISTMPFVTDTRGSGEVPVTGSSALAGFPFQSQAFAVDGMGDLYTSLGLELVIAP